jgi:hypothetical protein
MSSKTNPSRETVPFKDPNVVLARLQFQNSCSVLDSRNHSININTRNSAVKTATVLKKRVKIRREIDTAELQNFWRTMYHTVPYKIESRYCNSTVIGPSCRGTVHMSTRHSSVCFTWKLCWRRRLSSRRERRARSSSSR